jgi:hypothetical protein
MLKAFLAAATVALLAASGSVVWGKLEGGSEHRAAVGRSPTDPTQSIRVLRTPQELRSIEAPQSRADNPVSPVEWLIKRGEDEDIKCHSGLPDSEFHCTARGKITAKFEKLGLCRGNPHDFDDERRWFNCEDRD